MSDFFVILVLKTVIYFSKFLDFQDFKSLEFEHSELNSDITDTRYIVFDRKVHFLRYACDKKAHLLI